MTFDYLFKIKSVLNMDSFDRRVFKELYDQSEKLRLIGQKNLTEMPTFPYLLADLWAALYKNKPRLLAKSEIDSEVLPHLVIMEQVLRSNEFASLREYTKLDEVASALGTVLMAEVLNEIIQEKLFRQFTDSIKKQQELSEKANRDGKGTASGEDSNSPDDKQGKQANNGGSEEQEKHAKDAAEAVANALKKILQTKQARQDMEGKIQQVQQEIRKDFTAVSTMLGGLNYGQNTSQQARINAGVAINLAEQIKTNPKLRRIADLTGRLKKIVLSKQKQKTKEDIERTSVSIGNELSLLLPQEIILLSEKHKLGFLKKYAEGKLLQYSPKAKDTMGRGPLIVCLDTSGSMKDNEELGIYKDSEAKAVMLVLLSIAERQKRTFALINFSNQSEIKVWEFTNPRQIHAETVVEMAEFFWGGGTSFTTPLDAAVNIINGNKFKKADIIFISDGSGELNRAHLANFNEIRQKKKFRVIGINLGDKDCSLNSFADEVIDADSLMDQKVKDIVFSIGAGC